MESVAVEGAAYRLVVRGELNERPGVLFGGMRLVRIDELRLELLSGRGTEW